MLKLKGYNLIRSDDPSGIKKGGVCIYYKANIPPIRRDDLCSLSNCLVIEIHLKTEKCFLTCLYRLPSQSQYDFGNFCITLDTLMNYTNNELPTCSFLIGDFNARCSKWCNNDIANVNGSAHGTLTSSAGYKQIINKPNHTVNNSSSCIDLMFCSNLNVISSYGVHLSVFEKCHHKIIFGKISIRILLPPSYVREVWYYRKANNKSIQKAIQTFDWVKPFGNLSVNEKVDVLNETIMNIFSKLYSKQKSQM